MRCPTLNAADDLDSKKRQLFTSTAIQQQSLQRHVASHHLQSPEKIIGKICKVVCNANHCYRTKSSVRSKGNETIISFR